MAKAKSVLQVAVSAALSSLQSIAAGQVFARVEYNSESGSNSADALATIVTLRKTLQDNAQYSAAVVEIFGNGLKGKSHTKGKLAESFDSDNLRLISATLCQWRTVARSFVESFDEEAVSKSTMRAMYTALTKKPKAEPNAAATPAPAASVVSAKDFEAWARENPALAFEVLERAMIARKETIKASALHAMRGDFIAVK